MRKTLFALIGLSLLLSSCSLPLEYNGYRLATTMHVKVFYSKSAVKMDYSVMGRLVSHRYQMDMVVKDFVKYAKNIGGDAIIVLPADSLNNVPKNRIYADVLKYK